MQIMCLIWVILMLNISSSSRAQWFCPTHTHILVDLQYHHVQLQLKEIYRAALPRRLG